ncbi:hypothetical protein [Actinotalea sp. C106]|uniref:hypothetical protein n=1 Tax=Actinotalea sp. C106 TaxID=2908644 RepID=UPI0020291A42|nr:hypothetical protein [Actinotalea sp. C106]
MTPAPPLTSEQHQAPPPEWLGARWELDLRPAGVPAVPATAIDATTTPEAQDWARAILVQLQALGITARIGQDEGEDGQGNPTTYDELLITVGEGHMALAFWRGLLAWFVDVFPDQCDQASFTHVARTTLAAAQEVSGYTLDLGPLTPTDRALLGVAAP